MDWELYERQRATLLLIGVAILSLLLFVFQQSSTVRVLRSGLVRLTLPTARFLSQMHDAPAATPVENLQVDFPTAAPVEATGEAAERSRRLAVLEAENRRLAELLGLRQRRWPGSIAAHVSGRDPQRWFQELVLDKGASDGVVVDAPVVAIVEGREGLVGRITEIGPHVAKVMLIQDSLSAVASSVLGEKVEDGVVEGTNTHEIFLKFLDRSSKLRIGDPVVTSGLGKRFPAGIPVGWVEDVGLDQRQLFLQARLRPAVKSNQLHSVLILMEPEHPSL